MLRVMIYRANERIQNVLPAGLVGQSCDLHATL